MGRIARFPRALGPKGTTSVKAIRVHSPGGSEALRYEDVPQPAPGAGQVLVKVEAAGVNFVDVYQRTGLYKVALPFTLGQEAAGRVNRKSTRLNSSHLRTSYAVFFFKKKKTTGSSPGRRVG